MQMKKGSVTIYLTLVLSIILSIFTSILEQSRISAIRMKTEIAADAGLYSIFAEYNRELLKQYDLFFIDTSYGKKQCSLNKTVSHLNGYLTDNFSIPDAAIAMGAKNLTQIEAESVDVLRCSLASDENGIIFKRQAIDSIKDKYGISYINELKKQIQAVEDNSLLTRDIAAERSTNEETIDTRIEAANKKAREDAEANEDEDWEEITLDNPTDRVNNTRARGILSFVIDHDKELSNGAVNLQNYISQRNINKKDGLCGRNEPAASEDLLFYAYLFDKYGSYVEPMEKGELKYQLEYILAGKNNDMDNLKWVVNRLLFIRETANVTYLFSDKAKMAEAEALALTLSAVIALPELAELVKIAIIFAWAYAESIYDVKQLLDGKRIPLIKKDSDWHYSIEGMLSFEDDLNKDDSANIENGLNKEKEQNNTSLLSYKEGLGYKDYILILFNLVGEETKVKRAMDIVEMDIRKTKGNSGFCLDGCVDYLEVEIEIKSRFGYHCTISRDYCYF